MSKDKTGAPVYGTVEDALKLIRSGDVIATPCYANEPSVFLSRLHTVAETLEGVRLWSTNPVHPYPVMTDPVLNGHIDILSIFYGAPSRSGHPQKRISLAPTNLSASGQVQVHTARPTVFVAAVTPADADGNVYLSVDLQYSLDFLEAADRIIFEINPRIPLTFGETAVPLTAADLVYEAETPLTYAPEIRSTATEEAIAEYVVSLVNDGDCIQIGIGGTPNAVGHALSTKHDLGVHTEMITSSLGELIREGVITNRKKNFCPGKTVGAFAWGDQALYDLMDRNPDFLLKRSSWVNDPFVIAQNDNMVSINTALQIDLTGQVCSESIGPRQYSGSGGAFDFAYGAYRSRGGRSIIAVNSTAKGGSISRIQASLTTGAIVTISRNIVDYVVTEYGIAKLRDRTVRQRVENLIAVAHPDFRAQLREEAEKNMLW